MHFVQLVLLPGSMGYIQLLPVIACDFQFELLPNLEHLTGPRIKGRAHCLQNEKSQLVPHRFAASSDSTGCQIDYIFASWALRTTSIGVISRQVFRTDHKLVWAVLKGDLKRANFRKQVNGWKVKGHGDVQSFRSTEHEAV